MAKKKKHPEHENLERWLVSYADFITLLFATFTALYAIATAELSEMKDISDAISDGFQQQSNVILDGIASILEGKSTPTDKPNPLFEETGKGDGVLGNFQSLTYMSGEVEATQELLEQLREDLEGLNGEINELNKEKGLYANDGRPALVSDELSENEGVPLRGVEVALQERGLKVSFDSRLLFKPGSAQLTPESLKMLKSVAERIKPYAKKHLIHVEGHTDAQPIASARFPSNWELSTSRAAMVIRQLLRKHGFEGKYMAAVGYAASRPVASNQTAEGRAKNRRIDIIIHSKLQGLKADPNKQARTEQKLIEGQPPPKRPLKPGPDEAVPALPKTGAEAAQATEANAEQKTATTLEPRPPVNRSPKEVKPKLLRADSQGY